jgi:hypothetical protein
MSPSFGLLAGSPRLFADDRQLTINDGMERFGLKSERTHKIGRLKLLL